MTKTKELNDRFNERLKEAIPGASLGIYTSWELYPEECSKFSLHGGFPSVFSSLKKTEKSLPKTKDVYVSGAIEGKRSEIDALYLTNLKSDYLPLSVDSVIFVREKEYLPADQHYFRELREHRSRLHKNYVNQTTVEKTSFLLILRSGENDAPHLNTTAIKGCSMFSIKESSLIFKGATERNNSGVTNYWVFHDEFVINNLLETLFTIDSLRGNLNDI